MRTRDMLGRQVEIPEDLQRIVSLVPSQTELLYDLGLDREVRGITRFCIHPEHWYRSKTRVGGTKKLHLDKIRALAPDLIIANKEENRKEEIDALADEFPVWISDVKNLEEALAMISGVGRICGRQEKAHAVCREIVQAFEALRRVQPLQVAYLIWEEPLMVVGGNTFINDILQRWGLYNIYEKHGRYPCTDPDELKSLSPDLLILASEPFPFQEKHARHLQAWMPGVQTVIADGELFSWYGSRLRHTPAYLNRLAASLQILK